MRSVSQAPASQPDFERFLEYLRQLAELRRNPELPVTEEMQQVRQQFVAELVAWLNSRERAHYGRPGSSMEEPGESVSRERAGEIIDRLAQIQEDERRVARVLPVFAGHFSASECCRFGGNSSRFEVPVRCRTG